MIRSLDSSNNPKTEIYSLMFIVDKKIKEVGKKYIKVSG